jgi:hypothetical protein
LDSGADHPFGGVTIISTERGLIAVREYLERQRAFSAHLLAIKTQFPIDDNTLWAANRNEAQLRLEFNAHGILVAPAENDQMSGIQRVMTWLYSGQFKIAYTCPRTFEQMKQYRYAKNEMSDGQKTKEKVFKVADELPDCVRYALMTWPSLPSAVEPIRGRDLSKVDDRTRWEIEKLQKFHNAGNERDLKPADREYPLGDFYSSVSEDTFGAGW